MPKKWKTLETKQIFGNKFFGFRGDMVKSPKTDNTHPVWVMDAPTWVNVIPITKDQKVVMIKQYRFGSQEISLEIPGGMVDAGEEVFSAAIREMKEETGYDSKEVHQIGKISPNTLKYIKVLMDLKKHWKTLDNMEICEIGVGYGGQCRDY